MRPGSCPADEVSDLVGQHVHRSNNHIGWAGTAGTAGTQRRQQPTRHSSTCRAHQPAASPHPSTQGSGSSDAAGARARLTTAPADHPSFRARGSRRPTVSVHGLAVSPPVPPPPLSLSHTQANSGQDAEHFGHTSPVGDACPELPPFRPVLASPAWAGLGHAGFAESTCAHTAKAPQRSERTRRLAPTPPRSGQTSPVGDACPASAPGRGTKGTPCPSRTPCRGPRPPPVRHAGKSEWQVDPEPHLGGESTTT